MKPLPFLGLAVAVALAIFFAIRLTGSEYAFVAGYVVVQYIVLATAWNILGGYTGYVNFGTAAFFAVGAYCTVVAYELHLPLPMALLMLIGGVISGLLGLATGYLTLRLRGVYFSIATLALAVVLQTAITNWDFVGGSRGSYVIRPSTAPWGSGSYVEYLFLVMALLAALVVWIARLIERSQLGYGFATIRDDELAAEASGVPTLRLKLIGTTLSGGLMGMVGAPFPYFITYVEPASAFNLGYAVNSIAMPLVGGMQTWVGPLLGAILLGTIQEVARVTISSAINLLLVGVILVGFVILAPNGLVGLIQRRTR
jgi:branched-chain amino acid transport system permease protein